jgi:Na+/H+-dicarboxylate symporter/ABC-type amino acid transport substrate-binding protein
MSRNILLGLFGGIAVGLFFGEHAAILDWPARAFIQLLQVTVLPYIVTSLITGIASGTPAQARRLAGRGGMALLLLWVIGLTLVVVSPLALPPEKGGAFYATTTTGGDAAPIDWLDLYIPSNPFRSLANNVVPAVVVFSILLGVALLGLEEKSRIVGPLRLVNEMLGRAGRLLIRLTPFGIFAIAGAAAGTLRIEQFERLQAYFLIWVGLSSILTLWILPALVALVTRVPYRRILSVMWPSLVTAFITSNLFIVLPAIQERAKELLAESHHRDRDAAGNVDVLVPTSFTFPNAAKLLSLSFVLFAGWFAGAPVPPSQLPTLAGAGILSAFGSLNTAIPFLLNLMHLPADLFHLFMVSSVINSQFGSAAAAMHTMAIALLGAHFMAGRTPVPRIRVLGFLGVTIVLVGAFLAGSRVLLARVLPDPQNAVAAFDRLRVTGAWGRLAPVVAAEEADPPVEALPSAGQRLDAIMTRGMLRFCIAPETPPWSFLNSRGELVGFEIDVAHAIAAQLNTRLSLVTVARSAKGTSLVQGTCDLAIGRVVPSQASTMTFSRPLTHEAWAFLTHDYRRSDFATVDRLHELRSPRIAVFREPEFIERLRLLVPNAEVIGVESILEYMSAPAGRFDAMFTGFDRGTAASLMSPEYGVVIPAPDPGSIPMAFIVPKGEESLLDLANAIADVGAANGLFQEKLDYWIGGPGKQADASPRWSVAHDVLGWWK